jgi:hypothetical protein
MVIIQIFILLESLELKKILKSLDHQLAKIQDDYIYTNLNFWKNMIG